MNTWDVGATAGVAMKRAVSTPFLLGLALAAAMLSGCANNNNSASIPNSGSSGGSCSGGSVGATGNPGATSHNTILNGKYAFSLTGTATQTGALFVAAGSFTADGSGNITGGVEDVNILKTSISSAEQDKAIAITGNYSIGTDGRGTLNFTSGLTQTYKIAIENGGHGQMIRFDCGATGSGTFDVQTTSAFSISSLQQGAYVFGWNGADVQGNVFGGVGRVNLSGSTATGALDINDNGGAFQSSASATFAAPDSNGHGTVSFTYGTGSPNVYGYEIISSTRMLLVETDGNPVVGEADAQSTVLTATSLSGNYVFSLAGENSFGSVALVGQMNATAGFIGSSDVVENANGSSSAGAFTSATYNSANTVQGVTLAGRFTITATDPALHADAFAVYLISPGRAMILETDTNQFTFGQALAQTTMNYTANFLNANYGIGFAGFDDTSSGFEGDFVGQFTSTGTGTLNAGTLDLNYEGLTTPTVPNNSVTLASYLLQNGSSSTGHGTMTFTADGVVFSFHFFFVSPSQIFLIETDHLFVTTGAALSQPTIP